MQALHIHSLPFVHFAPFLPIKRDSIQFVRSRIAIDWLFGVLYNYGGLFWVKICYHEHSARPAPKNKKIEEKWVFLCSLPTNHPAISGKSNAIACQMSAIWLTDLCACQVYFQAEQRPERTRTISGLPRPSKYKTKIRACAVPKCACVDFYRIHNKCPVDIYPNARRVGLNELVGASRGCP